MAAKGAPWHFWLWLLMLMPTWAAKEGERAAWWAERALPHMGWLSFLVSSIWKDQGEEQASSQGSRSHPGLKMLVETWLKL